MEKESVHILVLDDDPEILNLLEDYLSDFTVHKEYNPVSALTRIQDEKIDMIISDVSLPCMSGYDFLKQLRALSQNIPVILISGYEKTEMAVNSVQYGAISCLEKPFSRRTLLQEVHFVIERHFKNPV